MKPTPAKPSSIIAQVEGSGVPPVVTTPGVTRLNSNALALEENVAVVKASRPVIVTNWLPEGENWSPVPEAPRATKSAPVSV